ncbi:argininosuccinate lyase [Thermodesulforhabdus norvegica]|uniref:Argininosuccinate lyase n=1 Tax=Thermodesulforhabdus norvegica TaxID=39841 RepID=A0A1I4W4X9_9BACT|nr:argininosuccinate lyase [Thermodesulforhabdus norvegica]
MVIKPWQGRFEKSAHREVEKYTESLSFDRVLYKYDILGSIAHCKMLAECGIISHEEASEIVGALGEIQREIERGEFVFDPAFEDIHMAIEHRLIQKIGDVGGKLHTARSRNDQVCLDLRLYLRDVILSIREHILEVIRILTDLAEKHVEDVLPGYTHLQHAQPVSLGHHLMAYCEMFARDDERFRDCFTRVNVLPLGSAALAGTTFPIDMEWTARYLGFDRVTRNSMDAVSDRDFAVEFLGCSAITAMHLSRLAEELVLWSSSEFGFLEMSDAFCTGSSIMPQKKNPDVAELMRGKAGRIYGNLVTLLTVLKGLPLTYNRDLQEDKEPVFDTASTIINSLRILTMLLPEISFRTDRMAKVLEDGWLLATELADYLVCKGVPFRKAHHTVGQIVKYAIESGKKLTGLSVEELRKFHKSFEEDVKEVMDVKAAVSRRTSIGGTAFSRVREAIEEVRRELTIRKEDLIGLRSKIPSEWGEVVNE